MTFDAVCYTWRNETLFALAQQNGIRRFAKYPVAGSHCDIMQIPLDCTGVPHTGWPEKYNTNLAVVSHRLNLCHCAHGCQGAASSAN